MMHRIIIITLLWLASAGLFAQARISELGRYEGYNPNDYRGAELETLYLTTRDSVRLAANLYLPKGLEAGKQIPTILYLTRYHRAFGAATGVAWVNRYFYSTVSKEEIRFFTNKGYAMMIVDVRGTGASTGVRKMEFTPEEIADGREIVDWIIAQPWSNGRVGSTGISYLGTTAQLLLVNQHPNVRAVINRSGVFDTYADVSFPGGVKLDKFIEVWRNSTYALDNYAFGYFGNAAGLLLKGPFPVKSDRDGKILAKAKEDHKRNFDIFTPLAKLTYRDEMVPKLGQSIDGYSVHRQLAGMEAGGTPIFVISGWYDGANARAAVHNYLSVAPTQRLLLGPWDHGPKEFISPFGKHGKVTFDVYSEMLRFFDYYLYDIENGITAAAPVAYYNMGQEEWRETSTWPVPETQQKQLYLGGDGKLVSKPESVKPGTLEYEIDTTWHSGGGSRWNSLTPAFRYAKIGYPDWGERVQELLTYTYAPQVEPLDITGHPVVHLTLRADADDATVFVYLQDRAPDGSVSYITEGQFRALHRKVCGQEPPYPVFGPYHAFTQAAAKPVMPGKDFTVVFDLLPVSYTLPAGHQLQLAIAGADATHFEPLPGGPTVLTVVSDGGESWVEMPVIR